MSQQITATPKFVSKSPVFHHELKQRVQDYFEKNHKRVTGNFALHFKAILFWTLYIAGYIHLVFYTPVWWLALVECIVMGLLTAAIGFNVMHDGGHGSFSKNKILNKLAVYSVNILGASAIMWHNKHNILHHTYTNIDGVDDDIEAGALLRLCPTQKKYKFHKFQHIYFWFLYSLLLVWWVFVTDYKKYFTQKIGQVPIKKLKVWEHFSFWGAKLLYIILMIVIPIYFVGFTAWVIGFFITALTAGFILSIVFQLAHTVEDTSFPLPDGKTNKIENEWAIHQLNTTANFATKNKVISWFIGGLNFQVEHHLFPKISHVHYPAISKIIKSTCEEFGIRYIEYKKMRHAISSHVHHLKHMGQA